MEHNVNRRICIVQPNPCSPSETFIQAHADYLPGDVVVIAGPPAIDGRPVMPTKRIGRAWCKAIRVTLGRSWHDDLTRAYLKVIRRHRPDVVLAEYGPTGADVMGACRRAGVPLVVHFHGFDASQQSVLAAEKDRYAMLFRDAAALVVVSRAMRQALFELGAPAEKVHLNPYGIDSSAFCGARPEHAPPRFIAVGRFCEKKAPDLTIRAFAEVVRAMPEARLRMIGFGPLKQSSIELAHQLGISHAVTIFGPCPPRIVQDELRAARCFVQHSVIASDGDSEGTPVAILEAGAAGLPVVSTRHAGIPEVVIEGETGFLVEERDVSAMAERMLQLAGEPALAGRMGRAARRWIEAEYSITKRIGSLWEIMQSCLAEPAGAAVP